MAREDRGVGAWVALAIAAGVAGFAVMAQRPPAPRPADAPPGAFSAIRAMRHVQEVARERHPTGSTPAAEVRTYLAETLKGLGLTPETQNFRARNLDATNVLARTKGTGAAGKKALLLCAHYDSVITGPGAGDNASGVAAVLETLRALQSFPPMERDLIVLLDDAEELGMLGAEAFVNEHPWAKDVGVVVNLDARGTSGPSVMFETSEGNGWLIAQYAKAAPFPLAASLSMDVYRLMPNNTNMTVFKRAGMAGLNFAFVGGLGHYHTPEDAPWNLSLNTLQHQGENALAMTRHFGGLDLEDTVRENVIYTTLLNRVLVAYPDWLAVPLALGSLALFLVVTGIGLIRGRLGVVDLAAGVGVWLAAAVGSVYGAVLFWVVTREMLGSLGFSYLTIDVPILTACALVAAVLTLALERWAAGRWSLPGLCLGALFWWVAASLATARWLPGGSYLFVWPALGLLLGLAVSMFARPGSVPALAATLIGSLPLLVLMTPMFGSLFESLSLRMTGPLMVPVVLYVGGLLPMLGPRVVPRRGEVGTLAG